MKEMDYNIMMMSTFLGFSVPEVQKGERRMTNMERIRLKYPATVADDYRYRGEWKIKIP